jgi:phosphopantothenoylcysteine synthetase/decarboxylase
MNILVTSGSTLTPIDRVRGITNVFRGRTGFSIAKEAVSRGHSVTLLANATAKDWWQLWQLTAARASDDDLKIFQVIPYRTFDQLEYFMRQELGKLGWDACIHSAAVSDYKVDGVFKDAETVYNFLRIGGDLRGIGNPDGKIGSGLDQMWLRLVPTPKLVDSIRDWGLGEGKLVKFKLEVNVTPDELFEESDADFIVANRLDDFSDWAEPSIQILDREGLRHQVSRTLLAETLVNVLEEK